MTEKIATFAVVKRIFGILTLIWIAAIALVAHSGIAMAEPSDAVRSPLGERPAVADRSLTISVITCSPGPEIYELVGHTAIRVRGAGVDSVFNYGVFDFAQPNFVGRFVRGRTDYMLQGYPFAWFVPQYAARGSKVTEQVLDLTSEEAGRLRKLLQTEALPQNRVYRYKYVSDNCATRVRDRIDDALGAPVVYTDSVTFGSFRDAMRAHHAGYPWYQFGIDLALGSGIDSPITSRQEMFAPTLFEKKLATATRPDGRPLVRETLTVIEGRDNAVLPPTPRWQGPTAVALLLLAINIFLVVRDSCRGSVTRWYYSLFFSILGLAGCLIAFLVFVSTHEATAPNLLIVWLNPLQLVVGVCLWWRNTRFLAIAMSVCDVVAIGVLLIVWGAQRQSTSPAALILMAATVILAASYAINALGLSYNRKHLAVIRTKGARTSNRKKK